MIFIINGQSVYVRFRHVPGKNYRGGYTECEIVDDQKSPTRFAYGKWKCYSNAQFDRAVGRKWSMRRALIAYSADRNFRRAAWNQYFEIMATWRALSAQKSERDRLENKDKRRELEFANGR